MLASISFYNCTYIGHIISSYILLRSCKEKEFEDKQLCITVQRINNIDDTDPLDN